MPGAGFLPEIVAVLIIVLGGSLFFRAKESPSFSEIEWDDAPHALKVLAIISIAAALYLALGFIVTMILMMLALLVIIEHKNVVRAGLYAACVTIVTYLVFVHVLQSPLPPGVLGYW